VHVQSNDVVAGLADLFSKFDAQERHSKEQQDSAERQIVAPTKLRDALHDLDPHRFSIGTHSEFLVSDGRSMSAQCSSLSSLCPDLAHPMVSSRKW